MIQVHVYNTYRELQYYFKEWLKEFDCCVAKTSKAPDYKIVLSNGEEHYFMVWETYDKWCLGRDYYIGHQRYHSGVKVGD